MRIVAKISQHRNDFKAIYKCEHCFAECEKSGYDDRYFHQYVVPRMACAKCGKKQNEDDIKKAE